MVTRKMELEINNKYIIGFLVISFQCCAFPLDLKMTKATCPELYLKNGEVMPPAKNSLKHRFRCDAGFTLYGAKMSSCIDRGVWYPDVPMCVKSGCAKPKLENGTVHDTKSLKNALVSFSCKTGFRRNGKDRLLCDGLSWNADVPTCTNFKPHDHPVSCDFEDVYLCGWSQDNNDDFDWTRWHGKTPTSGTGPKTDYTTKTEQGHYVFLETSDSYNTGDKANLISMIFPPKYAANKCLTFSYHMYGKDVGNLSVFLTRANFDTSKMIEAHRIFHLTGNQSNEWHLGEVNLPNQTINFQIVIQGTSGGFQGDIALDDVTISKCSEGLKSSPKSAATTKGKVQHKSVTTTSTQHTFSHSETIPSSETKIVSDKKASIDSATSFIPTPTAVTRNSTPTQQSSTFQQHFDVSDSVLINESSTEAESKFSYPSGNSLSTTDSSEEVIDVSNEDIIDITEGTGNIHKESMTDSKKNIMDLTTKNTNQNTDIKTLSQFSPFPGGREEISPKGDMYKHPFESGHISDLETLALNPTHQKEDAAEKSVLPNKRTSTIRSTHESKTNSQDMKFNTNSGESNQRMSLNLFLIVLVCLVSFSMILVTVVTWKWAKRNQRSQLGSKCDGYMDVEGRSLVTEAETCLEENVLTNRDTDQAEHEEDIVDMKQETVKTVGTVLTEADTEALAELPVCQKDVTDLGYPNDENVIKPEKGAMCKDKTETISLKQTD